MTHYFLQDPEVFIRWSREPQGEELSSVEDGGALFYLKMSKSGNAALFKCNMADRVHLNSFMLHLIQYLLSQHVILDTGSLSPLTYTDGQHSNSTLVTVDRSRKQEIMVFSYRFTKKMDIVMACNI